MNYDTLVMIRRLGIIFCFFQLLALVGCTPATVRFQPGEVPSAPPPSQDEIQIGDGVHRELLQSYEVSYDQKYTKRAERVLGRLMRVTPSDAHWKAYVVESPDWNAMTTPGNYIYIFTGLLDSLQSDDELAVVLAHEISHRLALHHEKSTGQILGEVVAVLAGAAVTIGLDPEGLNPRPAEALGNATTMVMKGFVVNPYSQVKEQEADLVGLFLMAKAGYDPSSALKVWSDRAKADGITFSFFSTHPASEDRHDFLKEHLPLAMERYGLAKRGKGQGSNKAKGGFDTKDPHFLSDNPGLRRLMGFTGSTFAMNPL